MQAPPPVPILLNRLATFAANVQGILTVKEIDWRRRPAADEWSLTEIVCHLRDVEREVHRARFQALLETDNAFLPGVSADEWARLRNYQGQDGPAALADFLIARQETIDLLKGLAPQVWSRRGQHAFFGPTSLHELLYLAVRHDELHWEQIRPLLRNSNS